MSKGGYGKRTLMAPEGAISLNDKDTVIAGTNLFPDNKSTNKTQPQSQQQNIVIDYDRLAAAMSKVQINNTLTVDRQVLASTVNSTNNTTSVQIQ